MQRASSQSRPVATEPHLAHFEYFQWILLIPNCSGIYLAPCDDIFMHCANYAAITFSLLLRAFSSNFHNYLIDYYLNPNLWVQWLLSQFNEFTCFMSTPIAYRVNAGAIIFFTLFRQILNTKISQFEGSSLTICKCQHDDSNLKVCVYPFNSLINSFCFMEMQLVLFSIERLCF